jgi:hypothetical protein
MEEFAEEVKGLAERILEIVGENLGLEKGYLKKTLAGGAMAMAIPLYLA